MPVLTRRQKQTGEHESERRLEEALRALLSMGFDRELILSTIQQLLEVYGDELGWKFIQEDSYKVVIERILEGENDNSHKRDELDDKENNTKQAQIHSFDVKFGENNLEAGADIELYEDKADGTRQSVGRTESQLSSSSISYGSLTRKTEKFSGISSVCPVFADRDGTFTFENDLGTSSAEVDEVPHCSSDRDGEVDRDVLPAMLDPLDDNSVSVKAEVVGPKVIDIGKPDTGSLQGSLGCKIEKHNSWERVGEDEAYDLMLVGKQTDLEERSNICTKLVLNTSSVLEVKKIKKEPIDEQSKKKDGVGYGQRSLLSPIFPTNTTSYSYASTEDLEPGEILATSDEIQEFFVQSSCNERNCMVPLNPVHVSPTLQVQPGIRGYANCFQNTSVPVGEIQKLEMPLYLSNKNSFSEGKLAVPLGRKPCHGWLSSDEELSPRELTISTLGNEVFCGHSEMAVRGNHFSESYGSGRNVEHETNIKPSIQVRLPDKTSTEYDCKRTRSEKDIRRPAGRLIQQHGNLSEDIVDKYGGDKYNYHNARKSVEMIHQTQPHRIEISCDESCKFHKVQEERNDSFTLFKTSNKSHSSQEPVRRRERDRSDRERYRTDRERSDRERYRSDRERYRSDRKRYRSDRDRYRSDHGRYRSDRERYRSGHGNDRMDRKHSQQPMDKHSSCHEKTSTDILKDEYQKREHRIKNRVQNAQNPVKQKEKISEYQQRQGYERKSENTESRSYENRHTSNRRNDSEKERNSMEADNKHPLLHVNNFSQEAKLGTDHDCAQVRDERVILETYSKIYEGDASPCKKRYKGDASPCNLRRKSRWM